MSTHLTEEPKIAFTVFAEPTLIILLLTLFNGAMRTAIKAVFLSSKSFLSKAIVNKGITKDFRFLFSYKPNYLIHIYQEFVSLAQISLN